MKFRYSYLELQDGSVKLILDKYKKVKETPCGYWIRRMGYVKRKWVSKSAKYPFVRDTEVEAMEDLKRRVKNRIWVIRHQTWFLEKVLREIK